MSRTDFYATKLLSKSVAKPRDTMKVGRFTAKLMRAERLKGEHTFGLPPGTPVPVYPVDMLPGCPADWIRAAGSYVCPVSTNWGLWFDWTDNDSLNTAILPSVKGMNPITGQKISGLALEKYVEKCPKHNKPFKGDERFCEECGYKWPPQNYVAAPNTLWWDSWKQPDGTGRQFFFSEDEARDIATLVIGKENVVPAFGFAFFEPKVRRELPPVSKSRGIGSFLFPDGPFSYKGAMPPDAPGYGIKYLDKWAVAPKWTWGDSDTVQNTTTGPVTTPDTNHVYCSTAKEKEQKTSGGDLSHLLRCNSVPPAPRGGIADSLEMEEDDSLELKSVSVGAGAKIDQDIEPDPLSPKDWKDEASGIIRLYFVFEPQFKQIIKAGINDIEGSPEGPMHGLPVG